MRKHIGILSEDRRKAFNYIKERNENKDQLSNNTNLFHIISTDEDLRGFCFNDVVVLSIPESIIEYMIHRGNLAETPSLGNIESSLRTFFTAYHNCDPQKEIEWTYLK